MATAAAKISGGTDVARTSAKSRIDEPFKSKLVAKPHAAIVQKTSAAAAGHHRHSELPAGLQRGHDLVGVPGECHDRGNDPVVGGVGGVFRPPTGRRVDLGEPGRTESGR